MAYWRRKSEFRPDTPRLDLARRLYMTPQQRRIWLQWGLYALLCLLALVLQDVIFSRFRIGGVALDTVPGVILSICVLSGADGGCVFSLVAALVYYFSGSAPGVYVILLLPLLGAVFAAFRQGYLHRRFLPVVLCTATAVVAYEFLVFGMGLITGVTRLSRFPAILMTAGVSAAVLPLLYPVVWSIAKLGGDTWKEQQNFA